jgi:hypothetical protein
MTLTLPCSDLIFSVSPPDLPALTDFVPRKCFFVFHGTSTSFTIQDHFLLAFDPKTAPHVGIHGSLWLFWASEQLHVSLWLDRCAYRVLSDDWNVSHSISCSDRLDMTVDWQDPE